MSYRFKGIFTPLTTPYRDEHISLDKLRENIEKYNAFDLSGYLVLGSTGESVFLSDRESEELVKTAKQAAASGKTIIAGTAKESTQLTLEFTNRMAERGADAALIRTPSYMKSLMDEEALRTHFLTIADSAKIPIIIYHIPRSTGLTISSKLIADLSKHSNIAGIKDSSGNMAFLGETISQVHPHFDFLLGAASIMLPGLIMGASGGIITLSSIAPSLCTKLYSLFQEKKWEEAVKLQLELIPLNKAIIETYGIPATKYALDLLEFNGGTCRPPLRSLDQTGRENIKMILQKLNLL
ncbi:dihydrodipicolinate synthase family protein [Acidobacteriota bacterium]